MPNNTTNYKEYFDEFAQDYERSCVRSIHWSAPKHFVKTLKDLKQNAVWKLPKHLKINEVGSGTGLVFKELQKKTKCIEIDYSGCDLSPEMLDIAAKRISREKLHLIDANKDTLPWSNGSADITCSIGVFQFIEERDFALSEMIRATRHGGLVAVSAVCFGQIKDPQAIEQDYDYDGEHVEKGELSELMRKHGLKVISDSSYLSYQLSYQHKHVDHYDNLVVAQIL